MASLESERFQSLTQQREEWRAMGRGVGDVLGMGFGGVEYVSLVV